MKDTSHQESIEALGQELLRVSGALVDVEKSEHNPFKDAYASAHSDAAKSLFWLGSRTERCPMPGI